MSQLRKRIGVLDLFHPARQALLEFRPPGCICGVLRNVVQFVRVFVQVEHQVREAIAHDVLPSVSGDDAAPGSVEAARVELAHAVLQVGGIRLVSGRSDRATL